MIILGIDPGQSGGIAVLKDSVPSLPVVFKLKDATPADIREFLDEHSYGTSTRVFEHAFIEQVHSMPKQGVSSTFKFGYNAGMLLGLLVGLGIPHTFVTPQKWQKAMGCQSGGDKNVTKNRAQQLFPGLKITHATADALLIAKYGQIEHNKSLGLLAMAGAV